MKIVVVGAAGKLGAFLMRDWAERHELCPLTREQADLQDGEGLRRFFAEREFDAVVNCAAMASPEGCEADPEGAELVNVVAPGLMAEICAARGAKLVHFSTDYAVDGVAEGLKDEFAPTCGFGHYGRTKLAGEQAVLVAAPDALVCRVSWIFGEGIPSFLESVLARARAGERLEAVSDKWSKPTNAADISRSVEQLLGPGGGAGVLHLVNAGDPESWWSYACRVVKLAHEAGVLDQEPVIHESRMSEVSQLTAPRPVHTALSSSRLENLLGAPLPHWEEAAVAQILAARNAIDHGGTRGA